MRTQNRLRTLVVIGLVAAGACSDTQEPTTLDPPTGLAATAITETEITLSWNAVTGATGYTIERAGLGGSFSQAGTATGSTYTATGLSSETVYSFQVIATAEGIASAASAPLTVETQGPVPLNPPASLSATAQGETAVRLTWTAAANATGYRIQRALIGGSFTDVADVTGGSTVQYDDTGLEQGTSYIYRTKSLLDARQSASSEPVTVTTQPWVQLTGNIAPGSTRTLSADSTYLLKGVVQVQENATLSIPAGTRILGDKTTQGTLLVLQGGVLLAQGTAEAPVVFTSAQPAGSRTKGDWGGVIINGRSNCNFPAGECLGEGNTGAYGGSVPDDSSGVLTYVRIEFAGIEFSPDNELNGLTLNGVGSRTVIHHIQSHAGLDDGIEWFGGTVDVKYALVTDASDDSFDWSTGWQGRGQFWIAQQDPTDSDEGWEIDNNEGNFEALPRTYGQIYNFTLVGKPAPATGSNNSDHGILFRRGYAGRHSCGIITGFGEAGLDVDDAATIRLADADSLTLTRTIFWENGRDLAGYSAGNGVDFDPDGDADGTSDYESRWAMDAANNNARVNPMLTDPFNRDGPDFAPRAGSPALSGACAPPNDGFFSQVSYLGAVADAGDTWYKGWTAFPKN